MKPTIIGLLLSAGIATFPVTGALAQSSTQIKKADPGTEAIGETIKVEPERPKLKKKKLLDDKKELPGDHFSNGKKLPGDHFSE
jgi:membrane protein insertase Oxa1/YidC/SpoIIIJ